MTSIEIEEGSPPRERRRRRRPSPPRTPQPTFRRPEDVQQLEKEKGWLASPAGRKFKRKFMQAVKGQPKKRRATRGLTLDRHLSTFPLSEVQQMHRTAVRDFATTHWASGADRAKRARTIRAMERHMIGRQRRYLARLQMLQRQGHALPPWMQPRQPPAGPPIRPGPVMPQPPPMWQPPANPPPRATMDEIMAEERLPLSRPATFEDVQVKMGPYSVPINNVNKRTATMHAKLLGLSEKQQQADAYKNLILNENLRKLKGVMGPWNKELPHAKVFTSENYLYHGKNRKSQFWGGDASQPRSLRRFKIKTDEFVTSEPLNERDPVYHRYDPKITHLPG